MVDDQTIKFDMEFPNGLFLYEHNGVSYSIFSMNVEGKPEYKKRGAGASKDVALVLTVYPGSTAAP